MKQRCFNPNEPNYHHYGGRGITVCERWMNFKNFLEDMGERPEGMSLDRINNDGDYEPGNCRWVDQRTQLRNKRTNVFLEHEGRRMTVQDWSKETGICFSTLRRRIKMGWPSHKVLTQQRFSKNGFSK